MFPLTDSEKQTLFMADVTFEALAGPRFTPGPWRTVDLRHQKIHVIRIFGAPVAIEGEHVANAIRHNRQEANARLIAAAPEMYEALRALTKLFSQWTCNEAEEQALDRARAALAKAEGR